MSKYHLDANGYFVNHDDPTGMYVRPGPVIPTGSPYGSPYASPYGSPYASPHGSPNGSPMYLGEDYNYVQPHTGVIGVPMLPASFVPLPPSPSMLMPLPPSPRLSPHHRPVALPVMSPGAAYPPQMGYHQQYAHAFDPYYFPQGTYMHKILDLFRPTVLTNQFLPSVAPAYAPPLQERRPRTNLHPLLAVDAHYVYLDLAASVFAPQTPSSNSVLGHKLVPLKEGFLAMTAAYPPSNVIYLKCSALGKEWAGRWRVRVYQGRTVSVGDVLCGAHEMLQTQISHAEWAKCTRDEMYTASRAYTRRVRKEDFAGVEGVRRVDLLGEKHYFAGVEKVKEDEFELLVKARSK